MKNIKLILVPALLALVIMFPLVSMSRVHAASVSLECNVTDGEITSITSEGCDLSLDKQVSINGGAFVEANTPATAVQAHVGDTVTWKITITNTSNSGETPFGLVTVHDILPSGVTAGSATPSAGTYTSGDWTFDLSNLPATLTLTSTANSTGLVENTAAFTDYNSNNCGAGGGVGLCVDPAAYSDSNSANDSDNAYVNVVAVPVVPVTPAAPTISAPNTGFGVYQTKPLQVLGSYLLGAFSLFALAFVARRFATKK